MRFSPDDKHVGLYCTVITVIKLVRSMYGYACTRTRIERTPLSLQAKGVKAVRIIDQPHGSDGYARVRWASAALSPAGPSIGDGARGARRGWRYFASDNRIEVMSDVGGLKTLL